MKKTLIVITTLMLIGWSKAEDAKFDFLPSPGLLAYGKVAGARVEEKLPELIIEVTDIKMLLYNSGSGKTTAGKIAPIPGKMTIKVSFGLTGVFALHEMPDSSWIGRIALFSGKYDNGCVTAMNGIGMEPFAFYDESTIQLIEQVVGIVKLTDSGARLQRLRNVIESPTEPWFLKNFAMTRIIYPKAMKYPLDPVLRAQLMEWRDNERLDPEIRLRSDRCLKLFMPRDYEWSEDRLSFLDKMKNNQEISEQRRSEIQSDIEEAQQDKSRMEKEKK
jgi:hypothetical protein